MYLILGIDRQGVAVPEPGLKRDVLTGMVISTLESWSEFVYALRAYQSKLQLDPAFYQANQALRSKDAKEAEQARNTVISFIRSIPTKSELAQRAVRTCFSLLKLLLFHAPQSHQSRYSNYSIFWETQISFF